VSKLVGYARISTGDQSHGLQLDALREAGCLDDFILTETASGKNAQRPELTKALGCLDAGDTLVVWKLDRLGRSTSDLINIIKGLDARGVHFRCLGQEGMDTGTANGKLIFTIFSAMAEFEHSLILERVNAGLAAAKNRGIVGGRKSKLTVSQVRAIGVLLADPLQQAADIGKTYGVSRATVYKSQLPGYKPSKG
jgi:DNA invertase Pin-like site-specific DNA recombinase